MPKVNNKQKYIKQIKKNAIFELCLRQIDDSSSDEEVEESILENLLDALLACEHFRYFVPFQNSVLKSKRFLCDVLPNIDEVRFTEITRMKWHQFQHILDEIRDDPVFNGPHSTKQIPVEIQMIIVFYRLGCSGEGATVSKVAKFFGVGDGGTITKITRRIFYAILKLQGKYLHWPSESERKEQIKLTTHELPFCVGYVDGTEIRLAEKPKKDPEAYFSRKQQYSLKLQITCDHRKKIMHIVAGYPGSVHDSRIYKNCALNTRPETFFSGNEWIAADSAYQLTKTVITPFKRNSNESTSQKRNTFNKTFCRYRVRVEHCIGMLKNRFPSLKELRIRILNDQQLLYAIQWVTVCCILHNIIIDETDETYDDDIPSDEENDENETEECMTTSNVARQKRIDIMELLN